MSTDTLIVQAFWWLTMLVVFIGLLIAVTWVAEALTFGLPQRSWIRRLQRLQRGRQAQAELMTKGERNGTDE